MEFSKQEYWSGLPFPSPGNLPDPGIDLRSPTLKADFLPSELPGKPVEQLENLLPAEANYFSSKVRGTRISGKMPSS